MMNSKEFEETLTNAGIDFNCFGYEGILNLISLYCDKEYERYKENGLIKAAEFEKERSHKIYEELKKRGYYN